MSHSTIGTRSQSFNSQRFNVKIRQQLNTLTNELSTGQTSDPSRHLKNDASRISSLDRRLALTESWIFSNKETSRILEMSQMSLNAVNSHRAELSGQLILVNDSSSDAQIDRLSKSAETVFGAMVSALNTQVGDRSLFSGNETETAPLASARLMLDDMAASVSGATTTTQVRNAIEFWFNDPAGGFSTMGYSGEVGAIAERNVGDGVSITLDARADAEELKGILKQTALAVMVDRAGATLGYDAKADLLRSAGQVLMQSAENIIDLQARIGASEEQVEASIAQFESENSALKINRNNMLSIDPLETATALEQTQIQLETHYTLTARLSRLSLTEYLR